MNSCFVPVDSYKIMCFFAYRLNENMCFFVSRHNKTCVFYLQDCIDLHYCFIILYWHDTNLLKIYECSLMIHQISLINQNIKVLYLYLFVLIIVIYKYGSFSLCIWIQISYAYKNIHHVISYSNTYLNILHANPIHIHLHFSYDSKIYYRAATYSYIHHQKHFYLAY